MKGLHSSGANFLPTLYSLNDDIDELLSTLIELYLFLRKMLAFVINYLEHLVVVTIV